MNCSRLTTTLMASLICLTGCNRNITIEIPPSQSQAPALEETYDIPLAHDPSQEDILVSEFFEDAKIPIDVQDTFLAAISGTVEEFELSKFPLIAAIPDKDIYLYGIKNNNSYGRETILYVGDTGHYYEIPYGTPRWILPEMQLSDFDGDGIEELAVINYYGSGTGVAIMGLQIIRINEKTEYGLPWSIYSFAPSDYLKQVEKAVSYKIKDNVNNIFELTVGKEKHLLDLSDMIWEDGDNITDILCSGDIVFFTYQDNKIQAQFGIAVLHKKYVSSQFVGTVYADCIFENNKFTLDNFSFMTYTEEEIKKIDKAVQNQKELFCDGKIINVEQNPTESDMFILQMNDGFWFDKVYLVKCADGKITESRLLSDECVTKAKFVPLGGFKDFFVELYYSTHMGNGGLKLFSLDSDIPDFDINGVYDCNTEGADYTDLQKLFPTNEFSFVYRNDYLDVKYAQPYNDEPNTISFTGIQQLLDGNGNVLDESECKVAYSYDSESKTMVLDKANCTFPKYWFYNWNAIGKEN